MTESGALPRAALVALAVVLVAVPVVLVAAHREEPTVLVPSPGVVDLLHRSGRGTASFHLDAPAGTEAIAVTISCRGDDLGVWTTRGVAIPCSSSRLTRLVLPAARGSNTLEIRADDDTRYALAVTPTDDEPDAPLG